MKRSLATRAVAMGEGHHFPLRVVDGLRLDKPVRDALTPGAVVHDPSGNARRLPRYFYEIPSWEHARSLQLTPAFALWELVQTDVREAAPLRAFPRYVPCAVTLLSFALQRFRDLAGSYVHVAANGGYRSPAHAVNTSASPHSWGTAANVYRVGDVLLDDRESIERYAALARQAIPGAFTRPYGAERGQTEDHLHIDLGWILSAPHDAPADHTGVGMDRRAS